MNKPVKISPDKRSLIAEAILAGFDSPAIGRHLIANGVSPPAAEYELKRAAKDPLFLAALRLRRDLAKSHWVLGAYGILDRQRPGERMQTVDKVDPERFFRDFYHANRPAKLTGLVDDWPALKLWDLDYLEGKVGDAIVELQGRRDTTPNYEIESFRLKARRRMREVIAAARQAESSNDFYLTANNTAANRRALGALWDDLGPVSILQPDAERDGFFWFGPKGTLTPFHHDLTNNLLVQVLGRKRVWMIAPWDLARVRNRLHVFSEWTPDSLARDPEAPEVMECVIGPGDALFIPVGWWHHVEALDTSISMSFTNFPVQNDFTPGHPADVAHVSAV